MNRGPKRDDDFVQRPDHSWPPGIQTYGPEKARLGGRRSGIWIQRPTVLYGGIALLGVVLVVAMVALTLPRPTSRTTTSALITRHTPIPTLTSSPTSAPPPLPAFALPAFSDWRAAYRSEE